MLGYLWSICRPLLLFAVLLAVFTQVIKLGRVAHYPVLLLLNIVLFGFFQEATARRWARSLSQEAIVRKTQFPRLVIPLAVVLTSVFNLRAQPGRGVRLHPRLRRHADVDLAAVPGAARVAVHAHGRDRDDPLRLYPRFRDVAIIWAVVSTALFYATPVLYPLELLSGTLQT